MRSLESAQRHQVIVPWTVGIKPTWTIAEVRAALRAHAEGDFSLSALLVDSMGEDDEIPGALDKRIDAVLSKEFELEAVEEPNRQLSQRLTRQFGPLWWNMFPESEVADWFRWYVMLGVSVAVLDWETGSSLWTATMRVLHPQFLRWSPALKKLVYYAQNGLVEVDPGDGTWLVMTDGRRGWMRGVVRSLAIDWIAKQLTIRDWNRFNERHGLPIIKAYAPAVADEADTTAFWDDLQNLQSETVAQLPTNLDDSGAKFDLELLEAKDASWQSFKDQLERIDRKIQIRILGANLTSEIIGAGSRAAADVHSDVESEKATADAKKISTTLRAQALWPIVAFNVAGAIYDSVPWPCWDTQLPDDIVKAATAAESFGKGLKSIRDAGYKVTNLDELADKYGFQLEEAVPVALPVASPPMPPIDSAQQDIAAE